MRNSPAFVLGLLFFGLALALVTGVVALLDSGNISAALDYVSQSTFWLADLFAVIGAGFFCYRYPGRLWFAAGIVATAANALFWGALLFFGHNPARGPHGGGESAWLVVICLLSWAIPWLLIRRGKRLGRREDPSRRGLRFSKAK